MPPSPLPLRPRLADHAVVRRYRSGGEDAWILHDQRSGLAYRLGAREWGLVSQADGTRDLEGIVAAASRRRTSARAAALEEFLSALHQAGLLAEGPGPIAEPTPRLPSRPLDPLPAFSLVCDGQGSCCRFYASVLFRPIEEAYARAVLPGVLAAGDKPEDAFMPLFGSSPCGASAVGLVDGRCGYLKDDGLCGLHEAQGPLAKPLGCRTFPTLFVDDGEAVRVAPAVECACVLRSAVTKGQGEPLVPASVQSSHDLDEGILVTSLSASKEVCQGVMASRPELIRFSRSIVQAKAPPDVAAALVGLSRLVVSRGLDAALVPEVFSSAPPIDPELLRPLFRQLALRAERRARIDASYRGSLDLARRTVRLIFRTAAVLGDDQAGLVALLERPLSPEQMAAEAFYLRASAHVYQLFSGDCSIEQALLERASRVVLARALPLVATEAELADDPAFAFPLALVEAAMRGHGLDANATE